MLPLGEVIGYAEGKRQEAFATFHIGHYEIPSLRQTMTESVISPPKPGVSFAVGPKVKAWAEVVSETLTEAGCTLPWRIHTKTEPIKPTSSTRSAQLARSRTLQEMSSVLSSDGEPGLHDPHHDHQTCRRPVTDADLAVPARLDTTDFSRAYQPILVPTFRAEAEAPAGSTTDHPDS